MFVQGQNNKIDSLRNIAQSSTQHDSTRCDLYIEIGDLFSNHNTDSALFYYHKSQQLSENKKLKKQQAFALRIIGNTHFFHGSYPLAIEHFNKSLEIEKKLGNKNGISRCYNNLGIVNRYQGNYPQAIEFYQQSLQIQEELGDKKGVHTNLNNIGIIHRLQGSYELAIEFHKKALKIQEELNDKKGMSASYNSIGNTYKEKGKHAVAIDFYIKSLEIDEQLGDKRGMGISYNNIGNAYESLSKYNLALEYHYKSLKIKEFFDDRNGISYTLANIASISNSIADSCINPEKRRQSYKQAIKNAEQGLIIALEINALPLVNTHYKKLYHAWAGLGNFKKAFEYSNLCNTTETTLYTEEKTKAITEMQTKYETESKQKEIDNQKLTIEKQEIEYHRQRAQRNYLIISSFLLFLLALFIFSGYRHKKLSNTFILEKNVALEQANEEIRTQKDELENQRDMVLSQKEHIERQQDKITQSIKNALLLQKAVLPSKNLFKDFFSDYFILFKPKDIVSGDFYWITRIREWIVFAVADCTGHGVPGALMTMLGLSFLKEIVAKKEITQPNQILDLLRESIIDALQQKGNLGDQKDGIDIALCALDTTNNKLQFAGANMPLLIVTAQKELIRVSPTLQPVAIHFDMKPFTSQEIQLTPGDCIYLASDGYTDQFGGAKHKKLMGKNLRELLVSISQKPMDEQREILETTFTNWKGQNEQTDDVSILGIKL